MFFKTFKNQPYRYHKNRQTFTHDLQIIILLISTYKSGHIGWAIGHNGLQLARAWQLPFHGLASMNPFMDVVCVVQFSNFYQSLQLQSTYRVIYLLFQNAFQTPTERFRSFEEECCVVQSTFYPPLLMMKLVLKAPF